MCAKETETHTYTTRYPRTFHIIIITEVTKNVGINQQEIDTHSRHLEMKWRLSEIIYHIEYGYREIEN